MARCARRGAVTSQLNSAVSDDIDFGDRCLFAMPCGRARAETCFQWLINIRRGRLLVSLSVDVKLREALASLAQFECPNVSHRRAYLAEVDPDHGISITLSHTALFLGPAGNSRGHNAVRGPRVVLLAT